MNGQVTTREATDIAHMVALQPQWRLQYQQLSAGHYAGRIRHALLPTCQLTHETQNKASRQQGSLSADHMGLALARSPSGLCRFHGHPVDGQVLMAGSGHELDLLTPDDNELLATLMPRAAFLGMLWDWDPRLADRAASAPLVLRLKPAQADHLWAVMRRLLGALADQPAGASDAGTARQVEDALVLAWQDAFAQHGDTTPGRAAACTLPHRRDLVEQACQLVRTSLARLQLPALTELCKALGASPRKLDYCFRDVLGITPARYLRLMRLNAAHHDLVCHHGDEAVTVQEIALRWGFWHLGAFATDHKRMFGRSPSQALGRPAGA